MLFPLLFLYSLKRVSVIGAGNWGTAVAALIADNLESQSDFNKTVQLWVHAPGSLVDTINTQHENIKYLPNRTLSTSIVATSDLIGVTSNSDFLVIGVPHQFLNDVLEQMSPHVQPGAAALSLIKGVTFFDDRIELATDTIERALKIKCGGLMGANIASDVAARHYCEAVLVAPEPGSRESADPWLQMLQNKYFQIETLDDIVGQQMFGTLKNVIAIAGGFVDGLGYGQSSKAAVLRRGLIETYELAKWAFPNRGLKMETMLAGCGFGDIVASSYGGRNRKCAEAFVRTGKNFTELEMEMLNGQKLAGVVSAREIFQLLKAKNATKKFPFFTTVNLIIERKVPPIQIFELVGEDEVIL